MGAAVFLLVLLVGPTVYAEVKSRFPVYIPKSPRRPIVMVWPSVMNPAVADAVAKEANETYRDSEYLKIQCDKISTHKISKFTMEEIKEEGPISSFLEARRAPKFWSVLVPELMVWVSSMVIECGFYTIFKEVRDQIYHFVDSNRSKWVIALGKLVYTLVQVIAVILHKTDKLLYYKTYGHEFAHLNWLEKWVEAYEFWYQNYPGALKYLQKIILNSLDIVTAWLYDYLAERTKDATWVLTQGIVCALENYDMVPAVPWNHLLDDVDDKMKVMAKTFMTCKVKRGCFFEGMIQIFTGIKDHQSIVRTPDPVLCTHTCTDVPNDYKPVVYAYAHMTTEVGHDLHCINEVRIQGNEVNTSCYPQVVEKYITDRQYNICKSSGCTYLCCKHPHCEIVTYELSTTDRLFRNKTQILITKRYPD